jgi:hypothetical protein
MGVLDLCVRRVGVRFGGIRKIGGAGVRFLQSCRLLDEIHEGEDHDPNDVDEVPVQRGDVDEQ